MELKNFLLLLFDKKVDRYPTIRESFLINFNTYEVTNILAITNYRCKKKERIKYTKHNFQDVGIRLVSTVFSPVIFDKHILINKTIMSSTSSSVMSYVMDWANRVLELDSDSEYLLNIDTSNTGFIIMLSIVYRCSRLSWSDTDINVDISLTIKAKSLTIPTYCATKSIVSCSEEDSLDIVRDNMNVLFSILAMTSEEIYMWCNIELSRNRLQYQNDKVRKYYISEW